MGAQAAVVEKKVPFSIPVEIVKQQTEEGALHIVGYAAATSLDRQGDIITPEALKAAAQDLLKNPTLFLDHDPKRAIGRIVSVKADKNGLMIDAVISQAEPEIATKVREGVLGAFSIRGQVLERERKFSKDHGRVVNIIRRLSLIESSLVGLPANPAARAIGWYISKALEDEGHEGGSDMDDVVVESISGEEKPDAGASAPSAQPGDSTASGQAAQPQGRGKPQEPPKDAPKPSEEPAPKPAESKPADSGKQDEIAKALITKMGAMLEPVLTLMDQLAGKVGDEAKPLAEQIKAMLLTISGKPVPAAAPAAAPVMSKDDVAAVVSAEVQKQVRKALDGIPTLRKGLAPGGQQAVAPDDEVINAFEALDPSDKLRALLTVQHGRKE